MTFSAFASLAVAFLLVAPVVSQAKVSAYSQDFESLAPAEPLGGGSNDALLNDGWNAFGNVFKPDGTYVEGYGAAVPNGSFGFSGVSEEGLGGPQQGKRQLGVYSDYTNAAHANGNWIESNVYRVQNVAAADIGTTWIFKFDARNYDLVAPSTARAFIHTRDRANGFQLITETAIDMTAAPATWGTYSIQFKIVGGVDPILQFGFANTATSYVGSSLLYDNISLAPVPEPSTYALMFAGLGLIGLVARRRRQ